MSYIQAMAAQKPFLIMAHRGFWGGNIVENTIESAQLAIKAGADVIELDACRSKDGVYYIFHSTQEIKLLGINKHFHELTSKEIDEVYLYNSIGMASDYRVNKMEDYFSWFPKDKIMNIDRSWWYWDDPKFFDLIKHYQLQDRVFLKNSINEEGLQYLEILNNNKEGIPYLPIVENQTQFRQVQSFENLNLIGIEMIIFDETSDLIAPEFIQELKNSSAIILMDGEKLGRSKPFFMGREDDYSMLVNPEEGWGAMYRLGANIIETDWPNFLQEYRLSL